jgi:hypothetical protein
MKDYRRAGNVISRDVITLDLDNIPTGATQERLMNSLKAKIENYKNKPYGVEN